MTCNFQNMFWTNKVAFLSTCAFWPFWCPQSVFCTRRPQPRPRTEIRLITQRMSWQLFVTILVSWVLSCSGADWGRESGRGRGRHAAAPSPDGGTHARHGTRRWVMGPSEMRTSSIFSIHYCSSLCGLSTNSILYLVAFSWSKWKPIDHKYIQEELEELW